MENFDNPTPAQSISQKNEKIGVLLTERRSDVIALLIPALISAISLDPFMITADSLWLQEQLLR